MPLNSMKVKGESRGNNTRHKFEIIYFLLYKVVINLENKLRLSCGGLLGSWLQVVESLSASLSEA